MACGRAPVVIYTSCDRRARASREVRSVGAIHGRTAETYVGCDGSSSVGSRWGRRGTPCHGHRKVDDRARARGSRFGARGTAGRCRSSTGPGRRPESLGESARRARRRARPVDRPANPRRPRMSASLDLQEHEKIGGSSARAGLRCRRKHGCSHASAPRLQPAVDAQALGGKEPPRSRWSVRAHRAAGQIGAKAPKSGDFGRHQEEGACWPVRHAWPRVAAQRRTARRERSRLPDRRTRQGDPVRRLRCWAQRRLRQRRDHGRHRGVRRRQHTDVVA
jgi:hypothetical protein